MALVALLCLLPAAHAGKLAPGATGREIYLPFAGNGVAEARAPIGFLGGAVSAQAVEGRYAYVGVGGRLVVLDVSDPRRPIEVGSTPIGEAALLDLVYARGHVYAILPSFDVGDEARPREIGHADGPTWGVVPLEAGFVVRTGRCRAHPASTAFELPCLETLDVADPTHPRSIGQLTFSPAGDVGDVSRGGGWLYAATMDTLLVVDIADLRRPAAMTGLPWWTDPVTGGLLTGAARLFPRGDVLWIADAYGLRIVDVRRPLRPRRTWGYALPGGAYEVAVAGGTAYVSTHDGIWMFDERDGDP